jgi:sigma-B regulation protein RsbU (phosphoserine phosphatase)
MGDVSDKGVPAALFMAITRTLFKTHFTGFPTADITEQLVRINNILSRDNASLMFVTAFACILDLTTGIVEYVDCGHEQPLILRGTTGEVELVKKKDGGLPLALIEEFPYFSQTFQLNPGDTFLLYTDGLEDAQDMAATRFTIQPSIDLLKTMNGESPKTINTTLLNNVNQYIGKANQFDDIALLTIKYNGA